VEIVLSAAFPDFPILLDFWKIFYFKIGFARICKMANRQKKLEEKYQKQVRDLATLPENKHCFDCHQRGPTYINMTIGSFVCTACSGIL
jgi:hypothetical protein